MKILQAVSLYTLVGVIGAGINFFVMPVLSHYLLPADYGTLSLFNTYITILIPVVSLCAYSLLSVDYYKEKNRKIFGERFTSIQVIPFFTTGVLAIVVWLFYGRFADDLELGNAGFHWGYITLLITFLSIYYEQFVQFLILQKKPGSFAAYNLSKVCVEVGLTFYFIIGKGWGWEGRMYSWLITTSIFFLLGARYYKKEGFIHGPVKWHYIREGIIFGSPLILHNIGKFVVNQSDRLFIVKMISISEAGIYNIGYTVGSMVLVVVSAFFNYYTPFLMERLSDVTEDRKLQIVKMGYIYAIGCVLMLLLIAILSPLFFRYFIDPLYYSGVNYVFWIALGYCFWGGYLLFSGFIFFYRRNSILAWLAVFNVLTNILFNYFFIRTYGAIGAAYATTVSFFLLMVLVAIVGQRLLPLPWMSFRKAFATKIA
ncbi:MAG: lipopolysaccharide biosynthesis protein [Flavisolibacter sp.]